MKQYEEMNFNEKLVYARTKLLDAIVSELEDGDTTNVGTLNQLLNSNQVTQERKADDGIGSVIKKRVKAK